jgi:hypothetical protein
MQKFIRILLPFAFIFFVTNKVDATVVIPKDSIPTNKPWKISQQQFLDQYGKDDTSRAIINYYFMLHNKSRKNLFVNTLIAAAGIALFTVITANGASFGAIILGAPFIVVGLSFGINVFIKAINLIYYSRKKLYKELKKYFAGEKIPLSLKRGIYGKKHFL